MSTPTRNAAPIAGPPAPLNTWATRRVRLRDLGEGKGVFVIAPIRRGEVIIRYGHVFTERPGRYSVQLGAQRHHAGTGEIGDFVNHSCDPTCRFDAEELSFRALRDLAPGDHVTYNYLTTERSLTEPFVCLCGAKGCFGQIRGFAALTPEQQEGLRPLLSPYLRGLLDGGRGR